MNHYTGYARQHGKTSRQEKAIAEQVQKHPETIIEKIVHETISRGGFIINNVPRIVVEKPINNKFEPPLSSKRNKSESDIGNPPYEPPHSYWAMHNHVVKRTKTLIIDTSCS